MCPKHIKSAAIVIPYADLDAMNAYFVAIAKVVAEGKLLSAERNAGEAKQIIESFSAGRPCTTTPFLRREKMENMFLSFLG